MGLAGVLSFTVTRLRKKYFRSRAPLGLDAPIDLSALLRASVTSLVKPSWWILARYFQLFEALEPTQPIRMTKGFWVMS